MAIKVITPEDMRDDVQERVDRVIGNLQAVLQHEEKDLNYYCVRIPEPIEYSSLIGAKIEAAYKQAGWGKCRCGRYWGIDGIQEYVQLQLWRSDHLP